MPEQRAVEIIKQLLNAFHALHTHHVIHRDIKLANIFLHDGIAKIGDFGFARELESEKERANTVVGTGFTMAPEVLDYEAYGIDADVYRYAFSLFFQGFIFILIKLNQSRRNILLDALRTLPSHRKK